jgi:hypothetical protein
MRVIALLNMTLDELAARKERGEGDFVGTLANQMMEDPLSGVRDVLDFLAKIAPPDTGEQAQQPNMMMNIKELYLNALQVANKPESAPLVLDAEPIAGTIGVEQQLEDW